MQTSPPPTTAGWSVRASWIAALALFLLVAPSARAAIDASINQTVWQLLYRVTDAQINDPAWLAADDDGDGVSNGNELAAGTNPFVANSTIAITSLTSDATTMTLGFPTQRGKLYVLEAALSLGAGQWATVVPAVQVTGDGTVKTVTVPSGSGPRFYRMRVQDLDTDGDGVSDWAEIVLGFNPNNSHTGGATLDDHTAALNGLAGQNTISIVATKPTATQPPDALTPATDTGTITLTRSGAFPFSSFTVALSKAGTAAVGTDYSSLPSSVTFPAGVRAITLTVLPLANPALNTDATVTVKALPGAGYTVGGTASASVVISPAGSSTGTGLTGAYYNVTSELIAAGYNAANLFAAANLRLTRNDPTVDFTWNSISPGTGVNATYYTVRWTGQVQPQYSETYYFVTKTDDGVKLWVNGQLLVDKWINQGGVEWIGAIDLKAGTLYDVKMEYYQATGNGQAHLSWYSDSQVKQIIPTGRLYPSSGAQAPPAVTSALSAIGFVNQPFSFAVTASNTINNPATFALGTNSGPLPPGLTLNAATGLITGTPTAVGDFQIALTVTNTIGVGASVLTIKILPAGSGVTRELWTSGVTGPEIANIPLNTTPSSIDATLQTPEDNTNYAINTGERLRGYFTAPTTGKYYFWVAANNVAELWISNDGEPVNKIRRAWVVSPGTASKVWDDVNQSNQKSGWLSLVSGQRYYYEVLHNRGSGGTNQLAVGWFLDPTGATANPIANGSGVVPDYLLTRFDYPQSISTPGVLYVTNMAPQGAATSTATGFADLRVSPDNTQATLHFNYTGLTSPRTAYHIHVEPSKQIVFDIDDADKFHPELRTADGGYIWNIVATGTLTAADIVTALLQGNAYINVHSVTYPSGEIRGNFNRVIGSQNPPAPVPDPGYTDDHSTDAGAGRFLNQAAFGASPSDVAAVQASGYSAWIDSQIALPATLISPDVVAHFSADPFNRQPSSILFNAWWRTSITANDQLRQRVAFALSEILVISDRDGALTDNATAVAGYYDLLLSGAFGNFRDLLKAVTLNPAMGVYLDMQANQKANLTTGLHPNENYAREIMQLFSIGLNRTWPDGTLMLDSSGNVIPTYGQASIQGMARVFTGWNWWQALQANGRLPANFSPPVNYLQPMVLVPTRHELGPKLLLDNVVLPAAVGYNLVGAPVSGSQADPANAAFDAYCLQNLESALDNMVANPNAGPFVCRQLIQRLVTSNPSPGYLARVVAKFEEDGARQHQRGNLGAVIKAILLDGEARSATIAQSLNSFGKQREPLFRIAAPARTFLAQSRSGTYSQTGTQVITVTTSTPHLLGTGNSVALDFSANTTGTPATELPSNPTSTNYTVLTTPAPTATTFAVNASGLAVVTYAQAAGSNTVTVNLSGTSVGGKLYLKFATGGAPDGIYDVASLPDSTHFTVTTVETPPVAARSGTVLVPKMAGDYVVTNAGSVSTISVSSNTSFNLNVGDHVWIDVAAGIGAFLPDGEFVVASVTDPRHFTITRTGLTAETVNQMSVYPLLSTPLTRSGNVTLLASKFDLAATNTELAQTPLNSTTVFNFFYPDYKYPGNLATANVTTPEFQLTTDTNIVTLSNAVAQAILSGGSASGLSGFRNGGGGVVFDLSPYLTAPYSVADANGVTALVNKLGDLLTGGQLTTGTKNAIVSFVANNTNFPTASATNVRDRVRAVVHMIVVSPEYAVQK